MDKLRVLMIPDSWGWAQDFDAMGVQKYSKHHVTICPCYRGGLTTKTIQTHDVVFVFSRWIWNAFSNKIRLAISRKPFILYCCGEYFCKPPSCVKVYGVCTERLVRQCKVHGIKNVALLMEGVDTEIFKPSKKSPSKQLRVGWAGNPSKKVKRFHLLKHLKYPVTVMTQHAEKYRVNNRTRKPMIKFYAGLDVYVTLKAQGRAHGVGLPLMEAMSYGLPVISTDVIGVSEVLPKAWLVPEKPDKLAIKMTNRKLSMLDLNRDLLKKVGDSNRQLILQNRSWKIRVKDWDTLFEEVIK